MANLLQLTEPPELTATRPEPASEPRDPCENCFDWMLDHDGTGSGLDADFLDGLDSTYFLDIEARLGYTPVNKAGDTMLGPLILASDPIENLEAATKQYVDQEVATATATIYPLTVYNEGVEVGEVRGLDFTGDGVSAAMSEEDPNRCIVTIDGGGTPQPFGGPRRPIVQWSGPGDTVNIKRDGVEIMDAYILNFIGDAIGNIEEDGTTAGQANITINRAVRPDTINAWTAAQHIPWRSQTFTYGVGGSATGIWPDFTAGNNIYTTINMSSELPNPAVTVLDGMAVNMLIIADTPSVYTIVLSGNKYLVTLGMPTEILIPNAILITAIYSVTMDKWLVNYNIF